MKKIIWINGNHQKFESVNKTYNRKLNAFTPGNCIDGGYISSYIRSKNEIDLDNGEKRPIGYLQDWDLIHAVPNVPQYIQQYIKNLDYAEPVNLYYIRHYNGDKVIIHGYILVNYDRKLIKKWYASYKYKSMSVIDCAIPYITN